MPKKFATWVLPANYEPTKMMEPSEKSLPAPMSPSDVAGVVLLVGTQAVLLTSVIVAFVLSLR